MSRYWITFFYISISNSNFTEISAESSFDENNFFMSDFFPNDILFDVCDYKYTHISIAVIPIYFLLLILLRHVRLITLKKDISN